MGFAVREEGRARKLRGSIQDITDRIQAQNEQRLLQDQLLQSQKLDSIGRLAGGVAHDFNNMLGVILGHADLALMRLEEGHPVQRDIQEMRKAADRSAGLTRQLLAFARQQPVAPKVLDLNETIAGMLKMLGRLIGENITLAWIHKTGLWHVRIDPSQVDQILANLAVNARDAIGGTGKVTISLDNVTLEDPAGSQFLRLTVRDDGCGMDPQTLDHVFEPFFTTKAQGQGTGLGLATVYGIVKQNDGFITVDSAPGKGSTFAIHLPRHAEAMERPADPDTLALQGHGETVLLLEDEAANLQVFEEMLTLLGYTVLACGNPLQALERIRSHPGGIDLLVSDMVMPTMNGREFLAEARTLRPGILHLFMSGYTADLIAPRGVLEEDLHFLPKPFTCQELASKIRALLPAREYS